MNRRKFLNWAAGVGAFLAWPFQAKPKPKPKPKPEPKPFQAYDLGEGEYAVVFTGEDEGVYVTGGLLSLRQSPPVVYDFATGETLTPAKHYNGGIDSCGLKEPYAHPLFPFVADKAINEHQSALLIHRVKQDTWRFHEVTLTGWSMCSRGSELTGWSVHFRFVPVRPGHAADFFRESLGEPYVWVEE